MRYVLAAFLAAVGIAAIATQKRAVPVLAEEPLELPPGEFAQDVPEEKEVEITPSNFIPNQPAPVAVAPSLFEQATDMVKDALSGGVAIFGTKYDTLIRQAADQAQIPWETLWRLLWKESRFREDIINGTKKSPVGALGIAQFMPATAREWLGSEAAALDPRIAIPGAARYLAWLQKKFGGDMTKAVAAYNWGIGNVQRKGISAAPAETRDYVAAILGEKIA